MLFPLCVVLCIQSSLSPRRKVRFEESRKFGGILDDDNWLDQDRREQEYQNLVNILWGVYPVVVHNTKIFRSPYHSMLEKSY